MNIIWHITDNDIKKIKKVVSENDNYFTQTRRQRNVEKQNLVINEEEIIKTMIMCLLTSQQRSGPNSVVGKFLRQEPFPITVIKLDDAANIEEFVKITLRRYGLTRFINKISQYVEINFMTLQEEKWSLIQDLILLKSKNSKEDERIIADKINDTFIGLGPKQSRNFLQALGLTMYEIPVDSRIASWLNNFGFPIRLTSALLGDKAYYHFILDGIQELCKQADVYPCILDAAIFSSFDKEEWTNENIEY